MTMKHTQQVIYIPPTPQFQLLDRQSRHGNRSTLLHSLITSTNLISQCKISHLRPATLSEALLAHDSYYLSVLHAASSTHHTSLVEQLQHVQLTQDILEQTGLVDDCPPFPGVYQLAMLTVGGAVLAAEAIIQRTATIACWFDGGRHHATLHSANGFCYLNDVVVACKILLSSHFSKLLYIDIDVHHADGVEQAFLYNNQVTTLSFHLSEPGFFPNASPKLFPTPHNTHAIRVPLRRAITDKPYTNIFKQLTDILIRTKQPDVIVLQCGTDALAADPLGGLNLTNLAYIQAVQHLLHHQIPLIILGGGGYNPTNAARVWTDVLETCVAFTARNRCDHFVPATRDIPFTDHYFNLYAPSFRRDVRPLQIPDQNDPNHLQRIVDTIRHTLDDRVTH